MELDSEEKKFVTGRFYGDSSALEDGPVWGMSLRAAGSMRFRWNEVNANRAAFLKELCGSDREVAAVELIHSKKVFAVESIEELYGRQGDGIITASKKLIPVITVADCMPVFLYEAESGVFGVLHSGWRGTGIVREAIEMAERVYGARRENFCVVMGPHIHDCCYTVDEERASYFRVNFGPGCVRPASGGIMGRRAQDGMSPERKYSLSLAEANLSILREMGVREDNIVVCRDCTCCGDAFGSFRRETSGLPPDMPEEERQRHFTVQAAWVRWQTL